MRKPKQVICRKKRRRNNYLALLDLNTSCKPLGQPDSVIDNLQNGCPINLKERINAIVTESRKPLKWKDGLEGLVEKGRCAVK